MLDNLLGNSEKILDLGEIDNQILDLKKEIADIYVDKLKEKGTSLSFIIGEGKSIKNYLVSKNFFDKALNNIKGNFVGNIFSNVDPVMVDYLKIAKEKLDNANTVDELKFLKNELEASVPLDIDNNQTSQSVSTNVALNSNDVVYDNDISDIAAGVPYKQEALVGAGLVVSNNFVSALPKTNLILTSPYGVDRGTHKHGGIDYGAPLGTPVYSMTNGVVDRVLYQKNGFGHYIVIKDTRGREIIYAHLKKKPTFKSGQQIVMGQEIGKVGNTGRSTGPHLHLEVRENGESIDPIKIFPRDVLMA